MPEDHQEKGRRPHSRGRWWGRPRIIEMQIGVSTRYDLNHIQSARLEAHIWHVIVGVCREASVAADRMISTMESELEEKMSHLCRLKELYDLMKADDHKVLGAIEVLSNIGYRRYCSSTSSHDG